MLLAHSVSTNLINFKKSQPAVVVEKIRKQNILQLFRKKKKQIKLLIIYYVSNNTLLPYTQTLEVSLPKIFVLAQSIVTKH